MHLYLRIVLIASTIQVILLVVGITVGNQPPLILIYAISTLTAVYLFAHLAYYSVKAHSTSDPLLRVLYLLHVTPFPRKYWSICDHILACQPTHTEAIDPRARFLYLAKGWPLHSGATLWPVPHPKPAQGATSTGEHYWRGKYGSNRRKLIKYVIDVLEKEDEHDRVQRANNTTHAASRSVQD